MGLLDLVSLAVDVHQSTQLAQARSQLQRLEAGALQEAANKQLLDALRNFVFTIGQNLRVLEQSIEEYPQQVYVAARALGWRFQDYGIRPEIFSEFANKEYVVQVQDKLRNVEQLSQIMLDADQLTQADNAYRAIVEMPDLEQAIEIQKITTNLHALETEVRTSSSQNSSNKYYTWGVFAAAFIFLLIPDMGKLVAGVLFVVVSSGFRQGGYTEGGTGSGRNGGQDDNHRQGESPS